ncbi:MAG: hypothetical protein LBF89_10640 [Bacteroidales bacterium]|nr:hypothetical protein [Bacteroidales bacterium]
MKKQLALLLIVAQTLLCDGLSGCSKSQYIQPGEPEEKEAEKPNEPENPDDNEVEPSPATRYNSFNMVGVDHFGRSFSTVSAFKNGRQVGMFYWPWIGQPYASGIYDATKIAALPNGIKILTHFDHYDPGISPNGQAHYWGEPLWGYYNSDDEWVIRKQMQMITIAGVDFIYFDTTNALIYSSVFLKVCAVIDEMLKNGWNPPKVVFYTHSHSFQTVRDLYAALYQPNRYPDTWYRIDGKPAIIAYTDAADDLSEAASRGDNTYIPGTLSAEILDFFHFLKPQWPYDPIFPDGFPWVEWTFPQPLHMQSQVMNVTVASHPKVPMSFSLTRENWINWGRGWNVTTKQNVAADVDRGTFFQSQWDRAIGADPPMISVGGWNEWIAYKQPFDGEYMLCDAANKEYSRDIEPMNGGYQDAFYLQLIRNIRRYKGVQVDGESNEGKTVDMAGALSQWNDVKYVVRNTDEKFMARDAFGGSKTVRYTQAAAENKLLEIRVTHDTQNLYFYLKGKDSFTGNAGNENWLNLFIGTGEPAAKGWESYEYVVGRMIENDNASIGKFSSGFAATEAGSARIVRNSDVILLSVPRSAVGLSNADSFYFKVAMGVANPSDIMDYYKSGSAMPMGRLSYSYEL